VRVKFGSQCGKSHPMGGLQVGKNWQPPMGAKRHEAGSTVMIIMPEIHGKLYIIYVCFVNHTSKSSWQIPPVGWVTGFLARWCLKKHALKKI